MDTPGSEATVEFTTKGQGYDPAEVDAAVSSMRAELAALKKGRGAKSTDRLHDPDRAVERMLAAAQQTADRVVYEAEAEAERVLAEADDEALDRINKAETKANAHVSDAESQGERIRKEAVTEARRVVEETRGPLAREVKRLRETRDALRFEIDNLRGLLSTHRESVRQASDSLRSLADDPDVFRVGDPGPRTEVEVNLDDDFVIEIPDAEIDLRDGDKNEAEPGTADAPQAEVVEPEAAPEARARPAKTKKANKTAKAERAAATKVADAPADKRGVTRAPATAPAAKAEVPESTSAARIVTLDEIASDDIASDETPNGADADAKPGRVITGAFADQLEDDSGDELHLMGENTEAKEDGNFLDTVRQAAIAETDGGLGEVDKDEDRAISNFFESAIEEPKSRFGRRNK